MKENDKVVILVGAGASVALNIPAMGGMFESFLEKKKSGLSDVDKKICKMFIQDLGVAKDLEEFLLVANTIVNAQETGPWKLIERIMYPSLKGIRLAEHRQKLEEKVSEIKDTRRSILSFMSRTCFCFDRGKATELLTSFVETVADKGYPVFTTNYDFSLEYAADEKKIPIHDNFVIDGRRYIWNSKILFPRGKGITLVKLHGSVTWYNDSNGVIEKVESDTTVNSAGKEVERLVVFPTRFKDIYNQHFFALYSHFLAALSQAQSLVIVGHSLRDEYIRAAIIEQVRNKQLRVIVVNPTWPSALPSELRPAKIGTSDQITHIPLKFEEFSDELAYILHSENPGDIDKACASSFRQIKHVKNKLKIKGKIGVLKIHKTISILVSVDAYVPRQHRPVKLRAWLEAEYTDSTGKQTHQFAKTFLNAKDSFFKIGLSGGVKKEIALKFNVPEITNWVPNVKKVILKVALLENFEGRPKTLTADKIIAEDKRELRYEF